MLTKQSSKSTVILHQVDFKSSNINGNAKGNFVMMEKKNQ